MRSLLLAVGVLLLAAGVASAHASLVASDPGEGAVIDDSPRTMTLQFDEPLGTQRSGVVVFSAAGQEVARGVVSPTDAQLMTAALPALPAGEYEARWTAVTPADGGVTRGTVGFFVDPNAVAGSPPAPGSPAAAPTDRPGGLPVLTPVPGTTPRPLPTATAVPAATATASPTAAPTAVPTAAPSPSPTPTPAAGGGGDIAIALVLAAAMVGGIALFVLRR